MLADTGATLGSEAVLTRRQLLVTGASTLALTACSKGGGSTPKTTDEGLLFYQAFRTDQPVGPPIRLPLALRSKEGDLDVDLPHTLEVRLRPPGGAAALAPMTLQRHQDGVPRGYYPLTTTFDAPGTWTIEGRSGKTATSITIEAKDPADVPAVPNPGDALPKIPTPTLADAQGVKPICTRDPACPFHTTSLDVAIAANKPIVLLVSTPAFCQTAICGPVLELLIDKQEELAAKGVQVLHAEVYSDGPKQITSPTVDALGLLYEPSLFLAGPGGLIKARLDYTFDRAELGAGLKELVS
jgi:hypothetical protein